MVQLQAIFRVREIEQTEFAQANQLVISESFQRFHKDMIMLNHLPNELFSRAYRAQNGEVAWYRPDALRVLLWATEAQLPILGIEIWIPTVPGPTIPSTYIYNYNPTCARGEPSTEFVSRVNREAAEYVRTFEWDHKDKDLHGIEPIFNITFAAVP